MIRRAHGVYEWLIIALVESATDADERHAFIKRHAMPSVERLSARKIRTESSDERLSSKYGSLRIDFLTGTYQ
jgi:hypothetical protein